MNYLSTLSIFMKRTTYLATLPNPNLKANECHLSLKVVAEVIGPVMASFQLRPCDLAEQDSLRPEISQEHPPGSIAGVLRLRA
jgi:hypothetical protein